MRQIDLIIKQQKRDWETEMQLVRNRLKRSEDELMVSRKLIEQKDLEVQSAKVQVQSCGLAFINSLIHPSIHPSVFRSDRFASGWRSSKS